MKCFVIMPISDHSEYNTGHFKRVYEYIIRPACINAGFEPIRADEILTTNHIALDIIRNILDCEMAICDLSSRNPNVLYELGIRQAFNLPVTLIKDDKTERIFDIQEFRDVSYDHTLRIDNVKETISELSETLKNTFNNKNEVNSLINLLGVKEAKITKETILSADTTLIVNMLQNFDSRLSSIENTIQFQSTVSKNLEHSSSLNQDSFLTTKDLNTLKQGQQVLHERFGIGTIEEITPRGTDLANTLIKVKFKSGVKALVFGFAKLIRVGWSGSSIMSN